MNKSIEDQAQQLYSTVTALVRTCQFRDREAICCHGLSVSQCYTLEALFEQGPLTMGELANHLCLEVSSMTRAVDFLVAQRYVRRVEDADDRRVRRIHISTTGHTLINQIRSELIEKHRWVLEQIPGKSREAVVTAMDQLLTALNASSCCTNQ